jgi:hypothetical protein
LDRVTCPVYRQATAWRVDGPLLCLASTVLCIGLECDLGGRTRLALAEWMDEHYGDGKEARLETIPGSLVAAERAREK